MKITVSPPREWGDLTGCAIPGVVFSVVATELFFLPAFHARFLGDFARNLVPGLLLAAFALFFTIGLAEQDIAVHTVSVARDGLVWTRQMKWWTRTQRLKFEEVREIGYIKVFPGFGAVVAVTKNRRQVLLNKLLREDAERFARELNRAVAHHRTD